MFNKDLLEAVSEKYFSSTKKIVIANIEGQRVDNGIIYIGAKAGPDSDISNLIHQMCHFVEIDTKRMTKHDWGFKYGKYWNICGQSGYEPSTMQSTDREIRTWAYQYNLLDFYKIPESIEELTGPATWINSFLFVPGHNDAEKLKYVAGKTLQLSQTEKYSVEMFDKEWFRKIGILNKRT